jgi:hypothetical protein
MKRYLLFGYFGFYPEGAMNDFIDEFDSIKELADFLKEEIEEVDYDFYQFVDIENKIFITIDCNLYDEEKFFEKLKNENKVEVVDAETGQKFYI